MRDEDRDADRLELILRLIDAIDRRLSVIELDRFTTDEDEIDLTSFRLATIGEESNKLSQALKDRHDLPWRAIYGLRNIVFHDYGTILPERIWITATEHLAMLADVCRKELARLEGKQA